MPQISVVVPSYNAGEYIEQTLQSLLDQQEADFEILLLDDASTDNTVAIARGMNDARIRIHALTENQGRPANANRGFDLARGEYIARIDHDDLALPGRLAQQARFLDANPNITVVGSQIVHFDQDETVSTCPLIDGEIKAQFVSGFSYLANPSTMFRRDFVQHHRLRYDPNLYIVDDLGFWFECMLKGANFENLPQALTAYRIHDGMTSKNLHIHALYEGKRRLYARLLPTFFPQLTGHDVQNLLLMYAWAIPLDLSMTQFEDLHRSAAKAMQQVDERWGASTAQVKNSLVQRLNQARAGWLDSGQLKDDMVPRLDEVFYQAIQQTQAG